MRKLACGVLAGFIGVAAACGPRVVPVPVVTTARFPEFVRPAVPSELALDVAARTHERAWSFLQAGDLPGAERELSLALKTSPTFTRLKRLSGTSSWLGKSQRPRWPVSIAFWSGEATTRRRLSVAVGRYSR